MNMIMMDHRITCLMLILVLSKVFGQGSFQEAQTTNEQLSKESEENEDGVDSIEIEKKSFTNEGPKLSQPIYPSKFIVQSNNSGIRPQQTSSWSISQQKPQPINNDEINMGQIHYFGQKSKNEIPQISSMMQSEYQMQPYNGNHQKSSFGQMSDNKPMIQPNRLSNVRPRPIPAQETGRRNQFGPPPLSQTGLNDQFSSQTGNSFQSGHYSHPQPSRSNFETLSNPQSYLQNQLIGVPNQQMQGSQHGIVPGGGFISQTGNSFQSGHYSYPQPLRSNFETLSNPQAYLQNQLTGLPNQQMQGAQHRIVPGGGFVSPLIYFPSAGYVLSGSPLLMQPPLHPYVGGFQQNNILGSHYQRPPIQRQPPRRPKPQIWTVNETSNDPPSSSNQSTGHQIQGQQLLPQFSQNVGQITPINHQASLTIPSKMSAAQKQSLAGDGVTIDGLISKYDNKKGNKITIDTNNSGKLNKEPGIGKIENKNPVNVEADPSTAMLESNIKKDQKDQHLSNGITIPADTSSSVKLQKSKVTPNNNIIPNVQTTINNGAGVQTSERDGIPDTVKLDNTRNTLIGNKRDQGIQYNLSQSETIGHSNSLANNQKDKLKDGLIGYSGNGQGLSSTGSEQLGSSTLLQDEPTNLGSENVQILSQTGTDGLSQNEGTTSFNHIKLITLPGKSQKINIQTIGAPANLNKNGTPNIKLLTMPSRNQSMNWNPQQKGSLGSGQIIVEGKELYSQNGKNTQFINTGGNTGGSFNQIRYVPGTQTQSSSRLPQIKFLPHSFIVTPIKAKIPSHDNTDILDESMDLFDDGMISSENGQKEQQQNRKNTN